MSSHTERLLKMVSIASLLGARHFWKVEENKTASSLVVSLGKALNGMPHLYMENRGPGNGNSQASADLPSKT